MTILNKKSITFTILIATTVTLVGFSTTQEAHAATMSLDQNSCENYLGGTWDGITNTCIITGNAEVDQDDTLKISTATLIIDHGGTLENKGKINNNNTIENNGTLENKGKINNNDTLENNGTLENKDKLNNLDGADIFNTGTIENSKEGIIRNVGSTIENEEDAIVENEGKIRSIDGSDFENSGTINNEGKITISNEDSNIDNSETGTINNDEDGIIVISNEGFVLNRSDGLSNGIINNDGIIRNKLGSEINNDGILDTQDGVVKNDGTINRCNGVILGETNIKGNPPVVGCNL